MYYVYSLIGFGSYLQREGQRELYLLSMHCSVLYHMYFNMPYTHITGKPVMDLHGLSVIAHLK